MAQSSTLNDLQFWQATTGESLQSVAEEFIWRSGSVASRRFPWLVLGFMAFLYYATLRLGWRLLEQTFRHGLFFNGSLIGAVGITALGYFCWRLTEDMGQRWQERQLRSGCEVQFSQPVFRFGEPMELSFRHFLKPGQPMPEGGTIRAQIYCEESTSGAAVQAEEVQSNASIPWQTDLGAVAIPSGACAAIASDASSQIISSNPALEARFDCTIPPGLPMTCSIDIPCGDSDDYTRLEVKWWLRFEVALPGIAAYHKALPIAVRS